MAEYEDKDSGAVLPTRSGTPQGGSTERKMLDRVGGSSGIRTETVDNLDGTTTTLRTRGGMPEFVTTEPEQVGGTWWPRGLVAYPSSVKTGDARAWSQPCLIEFSEEDQRWRTTWYNPPQTKKNLSVLPERTDLKVFTWTNAYGASCISWNDIVFYGLSTSLPSPKPVEYSGKNKLYNRWLMTKYDGAINDYPLIPLLSNAVLDGVEYNKLVISQDDTSSRLSTISGDVLFEHSGTKTYADGDKRYDIQLPPGADSLGEYVAFNSAVEHKFGIPGPDAYDLVTEKYYFTTRLLLPGLTAFQESLTLPTYVYGAGVHFADSGSDTNSGSVGNCSGKMLTLIGGGLPAGFVLHCSMEYPPYDMTHFMPNHQSMSLSEFSGTEKTGSLHGFRKDYYDMDKDVNSVIGYVPSGNSLAPVVVNIKASINRRIDADGASATGASSFNPGVSGAAYSGDISNGETRISTSHSTDDDVSISVSAGNVIVKVFEHRATAGAVGTVRVKDAWSGFRGGYSGAYYWEGYPGQTAARNGGAAGDGIGTEENGLKFGPPCYGSYVIFEGSKYYDTGCVAALMSKPTFFDQLDISANSVVSYGTSSGTVDALYDKHKTSENTKSPYAGNAEFSAKSRTILAADSALEFVAYIEVEVSAQCSYSVETWNIGLYNPLLTVKHDVIVSAVVEYKGVISRTELLNNPVTKIGPWDRPEIEDWSQWPWTGMAEIPGHMLVQPPFIFPDANKVANIDNVFNHQGVSQDLAGIPSDEVGSFGGQVIFSKRFLLKSGSGSEKGKSAIGADWILNEYLITESKRGANEDSPLSDIEPYFYCPELREKIENTYYQIEYDQSGLRAWAGDIESKIDGAAPADQPDRDTVCYRI